MTCVATGKVCLCAHDRKEGGSLCRTRLLGTCTPGLLSQHWKRPLSSQQNSLEHPDWKQTGGDDEYFKAQYLFTIWATARTSEQALSPHRLPGEHSPQPFLPPSPGGFSSPSAPHPPMLTTRIIASLCFYFNPFLAHTLYHFLN